MKRINHIAKYTWRLENGAHILNEILKYECDFELKCTADSNTEITISSKMPNGATIGLFDFAQLPFDIKGKQLSIVIYGRDEDKCYRELNIILEDV